MADHIFLNSDYASLLNGQGLVDLKRLLRWSTGDLVGEHAARTTWRTSLPDEQGQPATFYIRQEHRVPWSEILEDIFHFRRPASRGLKMLRATELFTRAGIGVAPLCGLIERRFLEWPTRAVAVQAHVPGRDIYNELLSFGRPDARRRNPPARRQLLYELGQLLAKMVHGRIYWPDVVAKHILVEKLPSERPAWRMTLIDVERAERGLNAKKRSRQLDRFLRSLRGLLSPTDLVRMARGYLSIDRTQPKTVRRRLWQKFFPQGVTWLNRAREEMAALRTMPEDQPLPEEEIYERVNGFTINMRFKQPLRELGLLEKDAAFSFQQGSELHKPGLGRRVRMRFETLLGEHRIWLYMKRVRHPKLSDQIDRILCGTVRHSLAWHERYMIKQLGACRIPTPVVVGYAEKMFLGYEIAGTLVTQGIIGQSLEKYVPKHFSRTPNREEIIRRRQWICQVGHLIRRFHNAGFCHRALYLAHIFISFRKSGKPVFSMIDLARAFKMGWRKERWIIKDLAALNYSAKEHISITDRFRFFHTYLAAGKFGKREKRFLRKILRKTRSIARHDAKHPKRTGERAVES